MPIYQLLRSKAITGFGKLGKVRAFLPRALSENSSGLTPMGFTTSIVFQNLILL